jgi:hypothetical protein
VIRFEVILPESGCRLTAVADTTEQVEALEQLGLPYRRVGHAESERFVVGECPTRPLRPQWTSLSYRPT